MSTERVTLGWRIGLVGDEEAGRTVQRSEGKEFS